MKMVADDGVVALLLLHLVAAAHFVTVVIGDGGAGGGGAGGGHGGGHSYNGAYTGRCRSDGYYYHDKGSIVLCSNGNSYRQPCAPGTTNKDSSHYSQGASYSFADFCNVNLNDYGYGASRPNHQHYAYYQSEPEYHRYGYHNYHQPGHHSYGPIYPQQHYQHAYFPPIVAHHQQQSYGH